MSDLPGGGTPEGELGGDHPAAIDTGLVRELADILNATDLTTIEVERGDLRIRVAREAAAGQAVRTLASVQADAPALLAVAPSARSAAADTPATRTGEEVKSPMVGTVYLQAQPGQPAFVSAGDRVAEGQTLLIIEAMKTMNPIPAPRAGTVLEVLVGDSQPVEYGEPLVVLD